MTEDEKEELAGAIAKLVLSRGVHAPQRVSRDGAERPKP